jgi:hypothetical protein
MSTHVRIGDAERDTAVERLGEHFAAGRLTKEEFDERATQASAARYDDDLRPLFADLPGAESSTRGVARLHGGWPGSQDRWSAGRDPWAARAAWQASHPRRPGGHVPPFVPVFIVAMVISAAVFITPWLLFGLFWIGCLASHGARQHARARAAAGGGFGAPAR